MSNTVFDMFLPSTGAVPPYYREVYDIVCPNQESKIDRDVIVKILTKSSLPKQTLSEVLSELECLLKLYHRRSLILTHFQVAIIFSSRTRPSLETFTQETVHIEIAYIYILTV